MALDFKVESKDWSWRLEPYWTLAVYDHLTRVAEIPAPFLMELVSNKLRELALMRRMAETVEPAHWERLIHDLRPRRPAHREGREPEQQSPELESVGARLRRARRARGLTPTALGALVGCAASWIDAIERGARLSPTLAARLAAALGSTTDELWPGVKFTTRPAPKGAQVDAP